jgi:hypothetical protein
MRRGGTRQRMALGRKPPSPAQWRRHGGADPQPYCRHLRIANRARVRYASLCRKGRSERTQRDGTNFPLPKEGRSAANARAALGFPLRNEGGLRGMAFAFACDNGQQRAHPPGAAHRPPSCGRGWNEERSIANACGARLFRGKGGAKRTRAKRDEGDGFCLLQQNAHPPDAAHRPLPLEGGECLR